MMKRMRRVGLMGVLGALVLAVVLASAALSARSLSRLVEAQAALTQTMALDKSLQDLQLHLLNAETGQRGYLLTGSIAYLQPYFTAVEAMKRDQTLLQLLPRADSARATQVQQLREVIDTKLAEMDSTIGLYDGGRTADALALMRSDSGRRVMDVVRAAVDEFVTAESRLTAERTAQQHTEVRNTFAVCGVSLALNLMLLGGLVHRMRLNLRDASAARAAMVNRNAELAELLAHTTVRNGQIHALADLSRFLQSALDIEEASQLLQRYLPQLLHADGGALYLMASSRNQLRRACTWGAGEWVELLEPAECWALRRGQPLHHAAHAAGMACAHLDHDRTAATDCLPLAAHGDLIGLLVLAGRACDERPSAEEEQFRQMTLEQVALSIGNLRLRESLRQQSIRDVLTGLYNRRFLEESVRRELLRATRAQAVGAHAGLSLLMLDVDHFKRFNDQHGHDIGDQVLREVAQVLQRSTRGSDVAARLGGEEFVVVLPDTGAEAALQRAEQLHRDVEQLTLRAAGQVLGPITLSVGVAHWPQDGGTLEALLLAADKALYEAKRSGRNRVVAPSLALPA